MNQVRAKFKAVEVSGDDGQINVNLEPVYSDDPEHENKKFWDATPAGQFWMNINNQACAGFFQPGHEYYIDITPAASVESAPVDSNVGETVDEAGESQAA